MSKNPLDIPIEALGEPTRTALSGYSELTDGRVSFDLDAADNFVETPDKPYTARNDLAVQHLGKSVATLVIIAFDHDDSTSSIEDKLLPRSKAGTHAEAHLTIATFPLARGKREPSLYAGNFYQIGSKVVRGKVRNYPFAELGQDHDTFMDVLIPQQEPFADAEPTATLTVGYRGEIKGLGLGERFGDPHAVYNKWGALQIAGFLAVAPGEEANLAILRDLGAEEPKNLNPF